MSESEPSSPPEQMPRWVWKAVAIFWLGFIATVVTRSCGPACRRCSCCSWCRCSCRSRSSPASTDWPQRGWRRGTATALILLGVFFGFLVFVVAIGTLVGQQIADLLRNSEKYVNRTVNFLNDNFDTQHQRQHR